MILKKYFSDLKSSISSIDHFKNALNLPLRNSFFFFIVSMIFLGIFNSINVALTKLPEIKNNAFATLDELDKNFGTNLEIIWADHQLELNQEYVNISWPSSIDYKKYELPNLLAIISNSETPPYESDLLLDNSSLMYLNKNNFYTFQENTDNEWTQYPLAEILDNVGSYSINKQNLPKIILEIKEIINQSFPMMRGIAAVIFCISFVLSKVWFLIIESIFVYFLFKIYNFGFNFKKVLKLSLNISVPAAIIDTVSNIFYSDMNFPMNSIAFWTILAFVSFNLKRVKRDGEKT